MDTAAARVILSHLPPKCNVQGFDASDITGDSIPEVVLSYREPDRDPRRTTLLLFTRWQGIWTLVRTFERRFLSTPVEVGYALDEGVLVLSQKLGDEHWKLTSYALRNGLCLLKEEWENGPAGSGSLRALSRERDLLLDRGRLDERYLSPNGSRLLLHVQADVIAALPHSAPDIPAFTSTTVDSSGTRIMSGSSSWSGPDDAALHVEAYHDLRHLHLRITVLDDRILTMDEPHGGDTLLVLFDLGDKPRLVSEQGVWRPRLGDARTLLRLALGFLRNGKVDVFVLDPDRLSPEIGSNLSGIQARKEAVEGGIRLSLDLPRSLFPPLLPASVGFCALYRDRDYPDREDWVTVLSTADLWPGLPAGLYGEIRLLPSMYALREYTNHGVRSLLPLLRRAGILK